MKTLIDPGFWSDSEIEEQTSAVKLTALWLMTNGRTSVIGLCSASVKRFIFETGLPASALEETLNVLSRSFMRFGDFIYVRHFIRYQFGRGDKLIRNNCFGAMKSAFLSVSDLQLKKRLVLDYPELEGGSKGLQPPREGVRVREGVREGVREKEGECEGKPSAVEIYDAYPRKVARPKAIKAIEKAMTSTDPAFLLARTLAFAKTQPPNYQFTPHPATWFNERRFDEPKSWVANGAAKEQSEAGLTKTQLANLPIVEAGEEEENE